MVLLRIYEVARRFSNNPNCHVLEGEEYEMTTVKKMLCVCLVLFAAMGLFGCGMLQQAVDNSDPESDQLLTSFFDALSSSDADAAFQLMFPGSVERADFDARWAVLTEDWGSSSDYIYQKMSVRTTISTDGKSVDNVYVLKRENLPDYAVSLSRAEKGGHTGITNLSIQILLVSFGG